MQKDIIIRPMRFDDLTEVYKLEKKLFSNPWPKSFFEHDLKSTQTIGFVVEQEGFVIGYSIATCEDRKLHLTNIAVDQNYQRQGIGSRLMQIIERNAQERGCSSVYLEVRPNNTAAIHMYKKLSYSVALRRAHYYIDGDDALVMEKELG